MPTASLPSGRGPEFWNRLTGSGTTGGHRRCEVGRLSGAGPDVPEPAETVPPQGGRVLRAQAFDEMGLVRMTLPFSFPSRLLLSLG